MKYELISDFFQEKGLIILGIAGVLPFILLAFYVHPVGVHDWDWAIRDSDYLKPGVSFFDDQLYWYKNVMGRFSSTALLSLTPYWFSLSSFKVFPIITILLLFGSLYFLISTLFLDASIFSKASISFGIFLLYLDQLTGVYEAFYNLSSVLTYQAGVIGLFFLSGLLVRLSRKSKGNILTIASIIFLIIFIVGTNEISLISVNALFLILLTSNLYSTRVLKKTATKNWAKSLVLFFIIALIFSLVEVLAPGNYVRMDLSPNANKLGLTLFLTIGITCFSWIRWLSSTPLLIFILLYIPFGIKWVNSHKEDRLFQSPIFCFLGLLMFQVISLGLLFWSVGDEALPERVMDLIFLISLPALIYFIQSLLFVLIQKKYLTLNFKIPNFFKYTFAGYIIFYLFFNGVNIDRSDNAKKTTSYISILHTNSNIGNAWLELLNGNAQAFNKEQYELYELVKNCSTEVCSVPRINVRPKFIYDKGFDRKHKKGEGYIGYYFNKKRQIIIYK